MCIKGAEIALAQLLAEEGSQQARTRALVDALDLEVEDLDTFRIECFDISHTAGESTQASCVVFENHKMQSSQYRRYNIDGITGGDDYAAMRQVLTRRYAKIVEALREPAREGGARLPDLVLVDGGRGQVGVAREVFEELGIDLALIVGVEKGEGRKVGLEELVFADGRAEGLPRQGLGGADAGGADPRRGASLRDHRHARRAAPACAPAAAGSRTSPASARKSGPSCCSASAACAAWRAASVEDLATVEGISQELAEEIYRALALIDVSSLRWLRRRCVAGACSSPATRRRAAAHRTRVPPRRRRPCRRAARVALPAPRACATGTSAPAGGAAHRRGQPRRHLHRHGARTSLLAIPVLEIELNGDGSMRRIDVLRQPGQAPDTIADRDRRGAPRGAVRRRVAAAASRGSSARPSCSTTTASSSRARSTTEPASSARRHLRHNGRMFFNLPTLLTWARIVAIPLIVGVFYLARSSAPTRNLVATVLFIVVALTDWADGYLARRLNMTSSFGAFLDPVADKFLVCAALLVLVQLERVDAFVALVIIGREIAISALREWMAQIGASRSVAVHMLGKVKTDGADDRDPVPALRRHAVRPDRHAAVGHGADLDLRGADDLVDDLLPAEGAARDPRQGALTRMRPTMTHERALLRAMPWVFVLIWSTGFVVARFGMPHAPPLTFLAALRAVGRSASASGSRWRARPGRAVARSGCTSRSPAC